MKIVRLIGFLFLLSSCNQYFGTVEPDYIPQNNVEEVFLNKSIILEGNNEIKIANVLYPLNKKINLKNSINFQKVTNIDKKSRFLFLENEIYLNIKNNIYSFGKNDFKEKKNIRIDLDKDEEIILIHSFDSNIFILTNKGKVFKSIENSFEIINDLQVFLSSKTITNLSKIILFSVFGEIIEIDLKSNTFFTTGNFIINHGITTPSNIYTYENSNLVLFNSGTLVFLNQKNNSPEVNYFLEDLNILSQVGIFEEFIDTPFTIDNFIYFIEKKGLISVFNPVTSEILWETDLSSSITDYFIDEQKNLFILTFNKIFIFSAQGILLKEIVHKQENSFSFWIDIEKIYLAHQDGLSIINLNGELVHSIEQKFINSLKTIVSNNQYYFLDSKNLYTLSE